MSALPNSHGADLNRKTAITRNSYGEGTAYYFGTVCEKEVYNRLVKDILSETGIAYFENIPDNVEITTRTNEDITARFIFNNTNKEQEFIFNGKELILAPFEMKIDVE